MLGVGQSVGQKDTDKEKAAEISGLIKIRGGGGGIRTLEAFRLTHFPGVLLRPLGHPSALSFRSQWLCRCVQNGAHSIELNL